MSAPPPSNIYGMVPPFPNPIWFTPEWQKAPIVALYGMPNGRRRSLPAGERVPWVRSATLDALYLLTVESGTVHFAETLDAMRSAETANATLGAGERAGLRTRTWIWTEDQDGAVVASLGTGLPNNWTWS